MLAAPHAHGQVPERLEAMMIATDRGAPRGTLPLVEERLQITIDGQHATTTLLQVYEHGAGGVIEGRYRLRPGSGSRVEGFAYWNGESKIVGEVFERQTAHRVYDSVTTQRRDPGLLEADGEGAFAFKVFPIQPKERKRVEIRWTKWLERRAQTVRYRAPVTRADAEILISLTGATKNLRSPTHKIHVEKQAGGVRVRSDGAKGPGELVLEWEADEPDWQVAAYVHPGTAQNTKTDGWFALSLAAPDLPMSAVASKDVTIVIDRSGSMNGEPMEHAKAAAADMIRRLDSRDRINVIAFSDEVDPLFKIPQPLDAATRERAIAFVDRLHDGGGTDIALALKTAIAGQDREGGRPRVVVFMTDGQSDIDRAMDAAKADTGDIRLFTLGLGKAVNKPLLSRLAAQKRGRFVYIEDSASIRPEVARLAASIAKPLLVDVSIDVEGVQAVRLYPRSLPDLFAQDELVVTGRIRGAGPAKFIVRGKLAGKPVTFTRTVEVGKAAARPWVGRLWAGARVDHLLEELSLGGNTPELMNEVLELALAYNFVTPYTAFLAIPESELGGMRDTVLAAREQKKKILAANPDVAEIDAKRSSRDDDADALAKPSPPQRSYEGSTGGDDEESEDEDESSPQSYGRVRSKRSGCAGCAMGSDATGLLVAFALAGIVMRRRRRAC